MLQTADCDDSERSAKRRASAAQSNRYERPRPPTTAFGDDEYHPYNGEAYRDNIYSQAYLDRPPPPRDQDQGLTNTILHAKEFWIAPPPFSHATDQHFERELLDALRSTRGGIFYSKSNHYQKIFYVDNYAIFICRLVPPHMIPQSESVMLFTELGKDLVRKKTLNLLDYSYIDNKNENFSIKQDLTLISDK